MEYFISYYDYYQPEAYVPATDTYIAKDASINEDIERLRLRATSSLIERRDVIVVSSVSCIYGLGNPADYRGLMLHLSVGEEAPRHQILRGLVDILYTRNDLAFERGTFRVRGDTIEVFPVVRGTGRPDRAVGGTKSSALPASTLLPPSRSQAWTGRPSIRLLTTSRSGERSRRWRPLIRNEMASQVAHFREQRLLLEAQRIETRTNFDLEMMLEMGTCPGIENYSRYTSGRREGERPACLLDYFPERFLVIVDESHVTVPQVNGMYKGDRSRKLTLVQHGFRLPSAIDNRPLRFEEWQSMLPQVVFVSATPRRLRAGDVRRGRHGADHPPHRSGRPADRRASGARPGG